MQVSCFVDTYVLFQEMKTYIHSVIFDMGNVHNIFNNE